MLNTPVPRDFLAVGLGSSLDLYSAMLRGLNEQQYVDIDIEDVLSAAVFQLNQRERPMVLDYLAQNNKYGTVTEDSLEIVDIVARNLYRQLETIVPQCYEVVFYDYLDTDLLLGVKPLE